MVYSRENESVAIKPVRVLWVEGHEFVEQDVSHWCHAHRGTRMANVGFGDGIDLQDRSSQHIYLEEDVKLSWTRYWRPAGFRNILRGVG